MLTERQQILLTSIVEDFVESGSPVGSKSLMNHHHLNVSAATIRAEMKKLEDVGLIEKPHISSGRVPSVAGYKYYVAALKQEMNPGTVFLNDDYKDVVEKIAQETQYLSVMIGDRQQRVSHIHLTTFKGQLMLLVVYQSGLMSHHPLLWQSTFTDDAFIELNEFINAHIDALNRSARLVHADKVKNQMVQLIQQTIWHYIDNQEKFLYMAGKDFLFDSFESMSMKELKDALQFIDSDALVEKLNSINGKSINVKIGQEIDARLHSLSLVTTTVTSDEYIGRLAVVGPKNMSYRRVFEELSAL